MACESFKMRDVIAFTPHVAPMIRNVSRADEVFCFHFTIDNHQNVVYLQAIVRVGVGRQELHGIAEHPRLFKLGTVLLLYNLKEAGEYFRGHCMWPAKQRIHEIRFTACIFDRCVVCGESERVGHFLQRFTRVHFSFHMIFGHSCHINPSTRTQVIGLDSEPVRDEREEYMLIHRHYNKLLSHSVYKQSRLVFIPENNLGMEAHHLEVMVRDIPEVTTFWEGEKKPGVCKTGKSTVEYQFLLTNALALGGIKFDRDLFTATREKTPESMMRMLEEQMLRYHWSIKKPNDDHSKERVTITGKMGSLQDDLLVTMAQDLYVGRMIIRDPKRLDATHRM